MRTMSRRAVLPGLIAALSSVDAYARFNSFNCSANLPPGTDFAEAEIDDFEDLVNDGKIDEQETPELCWAAAIHAVLVYHGSDITQDEVFQKVKGKVNSGSGTGTIRDIIRGLRGRFSSWFLNTGDSRALVTDLLQQNPVLIGLRPDGVQVGHVVVAYGATYVVNPFGATFIDDVELWDPAHGQGLKTVPACEIKDQIVFALHSWRPG